MTTNNTPSWLATHQATKQGWAPGQSGNPAGRPKGSLNRKSLIFEEFEKESSAIARAVVAAAKGGDIQAANLVLQRLAPPLKARGEKVTFNLDTSQSLTEQARQVLQAIASGEIDPETGKLLIECIGGFAGLKEIDELATRLNAIEARFNGRK